MRCTSSGRISIGPGAGIGAARILVVEDERIIALDLARSLRAMGLDVLPAVADGASAVRSVAQHRPDLVLMDVHLAGEIDGLAAAQRIWEEHAVRCLFLTAYTEAALAERARRAQPLGYLQKPFEPADLEAAIVDALRVLGCA